jgi:hypothetical protein
LEAPLIDVAAVIKAPVEGPANGQLQNLAIMNKLK